MRRGDDLVAVEREQRLVRGDDVLARVDRREHLRAGRFDATDHWDIEPQAQIIWQYLNFDQAHDPGGTINYDDNDAFTGRLGVRLQGNYDYEGKPVSPFLLANLWHEFESTDVVTFNTLPVDATRKATMLELGGGATADLSENVRVYANASYYFNLGGEDFSAVSGRVGLRIVW